MSYLDKIVKCPWCKQDVKDGDRIWLDGDCLCPECYKIKRAKYDSLVEIGYNKVKK